MCICFERLIFMVDEAKERKLTQGKKWSYKIKKLRHKPIWKYKIEDWNGKKRNLGQWHFTSVLDHNRSLKTPVYLNVTLNSLFRF